MGYVYHICNDCGTIVDFDEDREQCEECGSFNIEEQCIEEKLLCGKKENCCCDQLMLNFTEEF